MMQLSIVTLEFQFSACRSLKEKRSRVRGLKDRLGRQPAMAIAESGFQDQHDRSEWTVALLAHNSRLMAQMIASVEAEAIKVDGRLVGQRVESIT